MASITLELDRWPLVVTTIVGEVGEAEIDVYLNDFVRLVLGRRLPFVSIVDATRMKGTPSARVRQRIGVWEIEHAALGERYNQGIVIISSSALVRGAMTAISWIYPPRVPTTYEATFNNALEWACRRLLEREAAPPSSSTLPPTSSRIPPSSKPPPRPPISR